MLVGFLRLMGLAPRDKGKTGKREAAWLWFIVAAAFTGVSMWMGETMVTTMSPILLGIWGFAAALGAGAYGLEWREVQAFTKGGVSEPLDDFPPAPRHDLTEPPPDWHPEKNA